MKKACAGYLVVAVLFVAAAVVHAEPHAAMGSRVAVGVPVNPRYPGSSGADTLTDGATGSIAFADGSYLGFEGPDVEVTLSFAEPIRARELAADFLQVTQPAIYLPESVDFAVSTNGTNFRTVATLRPRATDADAGPLVERFAVSPEPEDLLAVRVRATGRSRVPAGHRSPQAMGWLFVSEILVNPGDAPPSPEEQLVRLAGPVGRRTAAALEDALRASPRGSDARAERIAILRRIAGNPEATPEAVRFAVSLLGIYGTAADLPVLAPLLTAPATADEACRACVRIGGADAVETLGQALGQATGIARMALIRSLGETQRPEAVPTLAAETESPDADTRASACRALAQVADPAAAEALEAALRGEAPEGRQALADACLAAATNLARNGNTPVAANLARAVLDTCPDGRLQVAALGFGARQGDAAAAAALLDRLPNADRGERGAIIALLRESVREHGRPVYDVLARREPPGPVHAALLLSLADRADPDCLPVFRTHIRAAAPALRAAALTGVAVPGDAADVPAILALLADPDPAVSEAAETALRQLPGDGANAALTASLEGAPPATAGRVLAILGIRGAREAMPAVQAALRSADAGVRKGALAAVAALYTPGDRDVVLSLCAGGEAPQAAEALGDLLVRKSREDEALPALFAATRAALPAAAAPEARATLLKILAGTENPRAPAVLAESLAAPEETVRRAALAGLAGFPDDAAVPILLEAAESLEGAESILAVRGAIARIAKGSPDRPGTRTRSWLEQALAACTRPEERVLALSAAGASGRGPLLPTVVRYLADPATADAARSALLLLVPRGWPEYPAETLAALSILEAPEAPAPWRETADRLRSVLPAAGVLEKMARGEADPLVPAGGLRECRFIGGDESAWRIDGDTLTAAAEGHGALAAAREYADYVFAGDFRLSPGANSGFFLRPPLQGNPAFEGMEVQILDDAADMYAGLRPDQYCASLYGIQAAEKADLLPAGEWQSLRVVCVGRRVVVSLNGSVTADVNLDEHGDKTDRIPGIARTSGFPALQNERGPVDFRAPVLIDLAEETAP